MSNSRHINLNWRGQTFTFDVKGTVKHFDGYVEIKFDLNPDLAVNPTGIKGLTVVRDLNSIKSAVSDKGVNLIRSPLMQSLSEWINDYFNAWRSLHSK